MAQVAIANKLWPQLAAPTLAAVKTPTALGAALQANRTAQVANDPAKAEFFSRYQPMQDAAKAYIGEAPTQFYNEQGTALTGNQDYVNKAMGYTQSDAGKKLAATVQEGVDKGYITRQEDDWMGKTVNTAVQGIVMAGLAYGGAAAAGAAGGGEAAAVGTTAGGGEAAGTLSADQLLAQSAAGLSEASLGETAATLGVGEVSSYGAAGAVAAGDTGTGAGVGSGTAAGNTAAAVPTSAAAAPAAAAPSTAAQTLQLAKDYGGIALTLGGLLAGGGEDSFPDAPSAPEAPPASQAAKQPDESQKRKDAAATGSTDTTLLTGASGIDPFSLNIGRSKLLGQ